MANLTFLQPSAVQCGESALQWMGGSPSYSVSVVSAQSALDNKVLAQVGSSFSPFMQYTVAIPAGTLIKFRVIDSSSPPQVADTILLSVGSSDDDSCLPADQRTNTSKSPSATASTSPTRSADGNESSTTDGDEGSNDSSTSSATGSKSSSHRTSSSSTTRGISAGERSGTSALPSATGSSKDAATSGSHSESHVTVAVVAGIAAGLILLIVLATGIFLWRKHRGRRSTEEDEDWFAAQPPMTSQNTGVMSGGSNDADGSVALSRVSPMARSRSLRVFMEEGSPNEAASTRSRPTTAHSHAESIKGMPPLTHNYNIPQVIVTDDSYPEDVKRPLVVMSADNYDRSPSQSTRPPELHGSPASQLPSARTADDVQVPSQLSPEEMARLADLVASRMRNAPDHNESLPAYH